MMPPPDPKRRERPAGRPGAPLKLIVNNSSAGKTTAAHQLAQFPPPPSEPLDEWKRRFLRSLAAWPFTLHPAQRDVLRWIAES
jgi:hypothetical protein